MISTPSRYGRPGFQYFSLRAKLSEEPGLRSVKVNGPVPIRRVPATASSTEAGSAMIMNSKRSNRFDTGCASTSVRSKSPFRRKSVTVSAVDLNCADRTGF